MTHKKGHKGPFILQKRGGQVPPSVRGREDLTIEQARQISAGTAGRIRKEDVQTIQQARQLSQQQIPKDEGRGKGIIGQDIRVPQAGIAGQLLDIGTAAIARPFQTIGAAFDPQRTVAESVNQFFSQTPTKQVWDLGITGLTIGSAGLALKAFAGAKAVGAVSRAGGTARITRTAEVLGGKGQTLRAITTQRAFAVSAKTSTKLAQQMAKLDQRTASQIVKRGIGLAWKHKGRTAGIVAGVTGAQMLWTWFAVDNVMTGAAIYSRDTAQAVRWGYLSRGKAIAGLDEASARVNQAKRFAQIQSLNPLVAIFSRNIRNGISQVEAQIDLQYRMLGVRR